MVSLPCCDINTYKNIDATLYPTLTSAYLVEEFIGCHLLVPILPAVRVIPVYVLTVGDATGVFGVEQKIAVVNLDQHVTVATVGIAILKPVHLTGCELRGLNEMVRLF